MDFVVTGGAGAVLLGAELPTGDVDVIYPMTEQNLANIAAALKELDAQSKRYPGLRIDDLAALLSGSDLWRWETKFGDLDMMTWASGAPRDYQALRQRAEVLQVGEHDVMVASVDDLIAMKRTTGRLSDERKLLELQELKILKEQARQAEQPQSAKRQKPTARRQSPRTRKPPERER